MNYISSLIFTTNFCTKLLQSSSSNSSTKIPCFSNARMKKKDRLSQASLYRLSFFSIYTARSLFKLANSGLIQIIPMRLSILFCIYNSYLFQTLFFVSHIFSTNPVPSHFFIIVCSSGGLQVD